MTASVASLNVKPKGVDEPGLPKRPVPRLAITAAGAAGDYNRYRSRELNGDPDSAILLLTEDILQQLRAEGWPVEPGDLGENVLLRGIANAELVPGVQLRVGGAVLQVSRACLPCNELYVLSYVGSERGPRFLKTLQGRRGWYARVLEGGTVVQGQLAILTPQ